MIEMAWDNLNLPIVKGRTVIDADGLDPNDTTTILQGAKASNGKALWSTRSGGVTAETFAQYDAAKRKLTDQQAEEARQLERLAAWGAQRTVIGGVAMTNAEAQEARQRVIDHGDHYAAWAVQQGYIRDDEKEAFIADMRRQKELEEKRGRGTITPEEEREAEALKRSRRGAGLDAATAQARLERVAVHDARSERNTTNDALRGSAMPAVDRAVFEDYQASTTATAAKTAPQPLSQRVAAMGLDL